MTTISKRFRPRLLTAVVVAIGVAIAWGMLVSVLGSLWSSNFAQAGNKYEYLYMTDSGEFLIYTYDYWPVYRRSYRTLDGEKRAENISTLSTAQLVGERTPPRFHEPLNWVTAMQWLYDQDQSDSGTIWYAIPDDQNGMYFEGYDYLSRIFVGYIGRKGFSPARPAQSDRFDMRLPDRTGQIEGWALRNDTYLGSLVYDPLLGIFYPWRTYVIDGGRLVEVDPRKRIVRTILDRDGALSVGTATFPVGPAPTVEIPSESEADVTKPMRQRHACVLVRYADRIVAWDISTEMQVDFPIPEDMRRAKCLVVYRPEKKSIWLQAIPGPYSRSGTADLRRVDADGKQLDRKVVELANPEQPTDREQALFATPVVPVPLVWAVAMPIVAHRMVVDGMEPSFGVAAAKGLATIWPALVIVLVAGVLSAIVVAKLQRRYFRDHTAAWVVTTFLAGPAMLVAYLVEHRGDATAKCRECSANVPAKRDACANCGTLFPESPLKGTEIFA